MDAPKKASEEWMEFYQELYQWTEVTVRAQLRFMIALVAANIVTFAALLTVCYHIYDKGAMPL